MQDEIHVPRTALKFDVQVQDQGRVELHVPFSEGARLTVFVIDEQAEAFDDLAAAAGSSLDFWDNPLDDEDWNDG
jgi:hypothetical protein